MNNNMTNNTNKNIVEIETPLGTIAAQIAPDSDYPGIDVYLHRDEVEISLARIEYDTICPDDGLVTRVWGNGMDDDFTTKVKHEYIEEAFERATEKAEERDFYTILFRPSMAEELCASNSCDSHMIHQVTSSEYFTIAQGYEHPENTVSVALYHNDIHDDYYTVHVIDDVNFGDCEIYDTKDLTIESIDATLKEIIFDLIKGKPAEKTRPGVRKSSERRESRNSKKNESYKFLIAADTAANLLRRFYEYGKKDTVAIVAQGSEHPDKVVAACLHIADIDRNTGEASYALYFVDNVNNTPSEEYFVDLDEESINFALGRMYIYLKTKDYPDFMERQHERGVRLYESNEDEYDLVDFPWSATKKLLDALETGYRNGSTIRTPHNLVSLAGGYKKPKNKVQLVLSKDKAAGNFMLIVDDNVNWGKLSHIYFTQTADTAELEDLISKVCMQLWGFMAE